MKNVYEVLRQKELELSKLEKEVEALRVAAPLLSEDKEGMIATRAVILPVTDSDHGPLPRHVQPRGAKYLSPALPALGS